MADDTNTTPTFPSYPPKGIPVADPRQAKPLLKILNRMLHPPKKVFKHRTLKWKKKTTFH